MAKSIRNLDSNVKVTSIGKTLELRKQVDQLHEVSRTYSHERQVFSGVLNLANS